MTNKEENIVNHTLGAVIYELKHPNSSMSEDMFDYEDTENVDIVNAIAISTKTISVVKNSDNITKVDSLYKTLKTVNENPSSKTINYKYSNDILCKYFNGNLNNFEQYINKLRTEMQSHYRSVNESILKPINDLIFNTLNKFKHCDIKDYKLINYKFINDNNENLYTPSKESIEKTIKGLNLSNVEEFIKTISKLYTPDKESIKTNINNLYTTIKDKLIDEINEKFRFTHEKIKNKIYKNCELNNEVQAKINKLCTPDKDSIAKLLHDYNPGSDLVRINSIVTSFGDITDYNTVLVNIKNNTNINSNIEKVKKDLFYLYYPDLDELKTKIENCKLYDDTKTENEIKTKVIDVIERIKTKYEPAKNCIESINTWFDKKITSIKNNIDKLTSIDKDGLIESIDEWDLPNSRSFDNDFYDSDIIAEITYNPKFPTKDEIKKIINGLYKPTVFNIKDTIYKSKLENYASVNSKIDNYYKLSKNYFINIVSQDEFINTDNKDKIIKDMTEYLSNLIKLSMINNLDLTNKAKIEEKLKNKINNLDLTNEKNENVFEIVINELDLTNKNQITAGIENVIEKLKAGIENVIEKLKAGIEKNIKDIKEVNLLDEFNHMIQKTETQLINKIDYLLIDIIIYIICYLFTEENNDVTTIGEILNMYKNKLNSIYNIFLLINVFLYNGINKLIQSKITLKINTFVFGFENKDTYFKITRNGTDLLIINKLTDLSDLEKELKTKFINIENKTFYENNIIEILNDISKSVINYTINTNGIEFKDVLNSMYIINDYTYDNMKKLLDICKYVYLFIESLKSVENENSHNIRLYINTEKFIEFVKKIDNYAYMALFAGITGKQIFSTSGSICYIYYLLFLLIYCSNDIDKIYKPIIKIKNKTNFDPKNNTDFDHKQLLDELKALKKKQEEKTITIYNCDYNDKVYTDAIIIKRPVFKTKGGGQNNKFRNNTVLKIILTIFIGITVGLIIVFIVIICSMYNKRRYEIIKN